ncbi:MAG: hypothetical protein KA184_09415 [Candidatus Hydrogenedentes bacterium]|nr:hypothetical protein [Candidatus Hydrogenedentota bacterium]
MKRLLLLLFPICALLFQAAPVLLVRFLASLTYGRQRLLPEIAEWPVSLLGLTVCAAVSLILGGLGVYLLLTRFRLRVAVPVILVCCVPALIGGALYLQAVLVFLTLV